MSDYYTEIFGKAPKAGTVIPGGGTVLKEVVVTPKRPRKYRFDRRVSTIGPGHDVISETLYDEYLDGQYMGDLSGVAGQRTIYVTPFGNDTIYGKTRNWQGGEPNRLLETGTGFMEVAPDRKDQARRKRQFQTNLKSSHVSPNSSKDEKSAYKRAIREKQTGGNLSKPKLVSKQQNKQSKPEFIPKQDQATKDSIAVNRYNDQEVQATKPGNYKQKNGKTVWVPDRSKAPYKKQTGGSLNGVPFYQNGTLNKGINISTTTPEEVSRINEQNKANAKGLFKGLISGKVAPTIPNIGRMIGSAYNGWINPKTSYQIGIAPTGTMRRAPSLSQMPERFRRLELERIMTESAKDAEKAFQNIPKYKAYRGESNAEILEYTLPNGKTVLVTPK